MTIKLVLNSPHKFSNTPNDMNYANLTLIIDLNFLERNLKTWNEKIETNLFGYVKLKL